MEKTCMQAENLHLKSACKNYGSQCQEKWSDWYWIAASNIKIREREREIERETEWERKRQRQTDRETERDGEREGERGSQSVSQ